MPALARLALAGAALSCNSLDARPATEGSRVIIPTDDRPAAQALRAAPISGGTLAVSPDGRYAVAADPDRDRISVVDLQTGTVQHAELRAGDEPGRVAVDSGGRAYVALRRAGDVVALQLSTAQVDHRVHICSAARGLALQGAQLHVACADGKLVTLSTASADAAPTLEPVRTLELDTDLRDVVVRGDRLLVSTFKQATLLELDETLSLRARYSAKPFNVQVLDTKVTRLEPVTTAATPKEQPMLPHLAWRTGLATSGELFMLHQGATTDEVDIEHTPNAPNSSSYGGPQGSHGVFGCSSGIVTPALTRIDTSGTVHTLPLASGVLNVDLAIDPRPGSLRVAIAQAGAADELAPRPQTIHEDFGASGVSSPSPGFFATFTAFHGESLPPELSTEQARTSLVTIVHQQQLMLSEGPSCPPATPIRVVGQATAVAFTSLGDLVVQSREPAALNIMPWSLSGPFNGNSEVARPVVRVLSLGGASVKDTGHELFHRDAGGGIACASCHAEGAEDGHTWTFSGLGVRRTQALHIGLRGTEPFHWSGDEANLEAVMADVFVGRMGGVPQSRERLERLNHWLFELQPPAAIEPHDSSAAQRGQQLFQSEAVGCASCHAGEKFTNNKSVDVGTGAAFQVPSLLGVGYRAPLMHTGCAARLEDRFDPACGGDKHGHIAQLTASDLSDLVAYMRTL